MDKHDACEAAYKRGYEDGKAAGVVRCKDCKYGDIGTTEDGKKVFFECLHGSTYACKNADWFCAYGERMDNETHKG